MGYIVIAIVCFFLGRKYGELQDIMLARRIAKQITQNQKVSEEQRNYEKYIAQDKKLGKMMSAETAVANELEEIV